MSETFVEEVATVVSVQGKQVTVTSEVKSTCSSCQHNESCGSGIVAKAIPHKQLSATIDSNLSLELGDKVVIAIPATCLLQSAWVTYFSHS